MASDGSGSARARSDADDRLISADKPIAVLQARCGGEVGGTIAVPALLETVRKARRYGLKLARTITANDGEKAISAWAEVEPRGGEEEGCEIVLHNWQAVALPREDERETYRRRIQVDRDLADLSARLDPDQLVLAVESQSPDLQPLTEAMLAGSGRPWTDFVTIQGSTHRQPLHWRLLDGADCSVAGSTRPWRATLVPIEAQDGALSGFELLLNSPEPAPEHPKRRAGDLAVQEPERPNGMRLIGSDLAPVLRQPIARIVANAETIRTRLAGPLDDAYAEYAADIAAAGQHLLGLLEDFSDLEIIESADFRTAPDRIDLAEVARQAAGILGVRAKEREIALIAPGLEDSVPAIAEFRRVLQVLLNVVSNAIRYGPPESAVRISLENRGERVAAIVADEGRGLDEEERERVFEKFERLGRSGDGGSGLGLYISRRLARAMGGDLKVESEAGEGARFVLTLPADPD